MNRKLATIREFRTAHFAVAVEAYPDEDLDLSSWDEDGSVAEGLNSGALVAFVAQVRVIHDALGEIASTSLGGCIYGDFADIEDHRECGAYNRELIAKGERGRCGSQFSGMIAEACSEARASLRAAKGIHVRAAVQS